jgi:hypothetical protein
MVCRRYLEYCSFDASKRVISIIEVEIAEVRWRQDRIDGGREVVQW